jgi:tight adherence protein B
MPSAILPHPDFAGILRQEETYAAPGSDTLGNRLNSGFDRLMMQSGMDLAPSMLLALSLCAAITLGGLAFVVQENLLTTGLAAGLGTVLPILTAVIIRVRRQATLLKQLPAMLDELARAAKTGRSLENCLQMVAADTPAPLGRELQRCTRRLELGMSIHGAFAELPERTGLVSANVLVTALTVHRETGGDLVKVLERLAQTVRDRIQFQGRLRAATAASRATAILMIVLPPAVLLFFTFRDPGYFTSLVNSQWGRRALVIAVVLQFIGTSWVLRIMKSAQRT